MSVVVPPLPYRYQWRSFQRENALPLRGDVVSIQRDFSTEHVSAPSMTTVEPKVPWTRIAHRLVVELWLAAVIALIWTLWVWYSADPAATPTALVTAFFTALFFVAFFTGSVVRVARQTGVQSSFGRLEDRLTALAERLEHSSTSIVDAVTGGNSYASASFPTIDGAARRASFMAVQHGDHALFDVTFEVADLSNSDPAKPFDNRWLFHYPTMIAGHAAWDPEESVPIRSDPQDFNIFITARNGSWVQRVRFATVRQTWAVAWVLGRRDGKEMMELSRFKDPEFPDDQMPSLRTARD